MKLHYVFTGAILCLLLAACSSAQPVSPTSLPTSVASDTQVPTVTRTPRPSFTPITPWPTNTKAPTNTPRPTNTPKPTNTTTPTPEPVVLTGIGDGVVDFVWSGLGLLHITYSGGSNFAVISYDTNGEYLDLLVNTIGSYEGTVPLNFMEKGATRFEIKSSGNWEIQILPLGMIRREVIPGTITGIGDDVIYLDGKDPDLVKVDASTAKSNFSIWAWSATDVDLLVNEIAPYTGTVVALSDMYLLVVGADGNWSIEVTTR